MQMLLWLYPWSQYMLKFDAQSVQINRVSLHVTLYITSNMLWAKSHPNDQLTKLKHWYALMCIRFGSMILLLYVLIECRGKWRWWKKTPIKRNSGNFKDHSSNQHCWEMVALCDCKGFNETRVKWGQREWG